MATVDISHFRTHHPALATYLMWSLVVMVVFGVVLWVVGMRQRANQRVRQRQQRQLRKRGKSRKRR